MTNSKLRKVLLQELGITRQAIFQRVQKIKKQCPMTTDQATYIIAHWEGISLDKYLDQTSLAEIRSLIQIISQPVPLTSPVKKTALKTKDNRQKEPKVIEIAKKFRITDPILPQQKITAAKEMTEVYPLLYVLENSIREVIEQVMTTKHGANWWDSQASNKLKHTVAVPMADEEKHSWHQRRGARPIDYLDLNHLPALMRQIEQDVVPDIIPSIEWFTQFVNEVYKSRCVVCHMNPLDKNNIQALKVRFNQWNNLVNTKKNLILTQPQ